LHPLTGLRTCRCRLAFIALAFAGVFLEPSASAQSVPDGVDDSTQVQLDFDVPSQCADRTQFVERVHARSERIQFASAATQQLVISVQGEGANWAGRVSFMEPAQEPVSRQISARSCEEVVDGLALVTVMVLDPEAMQRATTQEPSPQALPTARAASPPPGNVPPPKPKPVAFTESDVPGHVRYGMDALFAGLIGPAPNALFGVGVSIHASWVKPRSLFWPKLRLTYSHSTQSGYSARAGTASFTLDNLTLGVCPLALSWASWGLRPCVAGSYGRLTAAGTRTFVPVTEHLTWAELDAQAEITWSPGHNIEIFVAPGAGLGLKRYSFSFLPYAFYQEPRVMLSCSVGVGLQFE